MCPDTTCLNCIHYTFTTKLISKHVKDFHLQSDILYWHASTFWTCNLSSIMPSFNFSMLGLWMPYWEKTNSAWGNRVNTDWLDWRQRVSRQTWSLNLDSCHAFGILIRKHKPNFDCRSVADDNIAVAVTQWHRMIRDTRNPTRDTQRILERCWNPYTVYKRQM